MQTLPAEALQPVETLQIKGGSRPSKIHIAAGGFDELATHVSEFAPSQVISVLDAGVAPHLERRWLDAMSASGLAGPVLHVPAGEASKSWAGLQALVDACLEAKIDRQAVCVAIGGGVVGDLAGFAASIVLRGIRLVQVPTTLLAMVDSSVGGKTGIDTAAGKNLVGTFYPADLVMIDPDILSTLPHRHMRSGYGEIIKYGLICDRSWYDWCLAHGSELVSEPQGSNAQRAVSHLAVEAITRCCQIKAKIVEQDEKETTGDRALLNLGHTFAHAYESALGYSEALLHGEAVAIGLVDAAQLSSDLGLIDRVEVETLRHHLNTCGLKTELRDVAPPPQGWQTDDLIARMHGDKKGRDGEPRFVILKEIGRAELCQESLLDKVYDQLQASCRA